MPLSKAAGSRSKTAAYHHGDLRAALIAEARLALQTRSPEDITLTSLAFGLGVSQPAPYRHFASRDVMLAAVAEDGFAQFNNALVEAGRAGPPEQVLHRLCLAYVRFGHDHWGVYKLMFSRRTLATATPGTKLACLADAAFEHLATRVSGGGARRARVSVIIWAALHGLVMLSGDALLAGPLHRTISMEELVSEIVASCAG